MSNTVTSRAGHRRVEELEAAFAVLNGAGIRLPPSCGIAWAGTHRVWAGSDEYARLFERIQSEVGEGPRRVVLATGLPVPVPEVATEHRWPAFTALARVYGLVGAHSEPLHIAGRTAGAITWYWTGEPGPEVSDLRAGATAVATFLTPQAGPDRPEPAGGHGGSNGMLGTAVDIVGVWFCVEPGVALSMLRRVARCQGLSMAEQSRIVVNCALTSAWKLKAPRGQPTREQLTAALATASAAGRRRKRQLGDAPVAVTGPR
ncbi:MAG TPA: hypothetical protein VHU88_18320 [Sporichthyaceae bacterium]|nr:hypothetical protein [Sporichthyaceae bacterium]